MLWGHKKEAAQVGAAPAAGANRWDAAQFSSRAEQERFLKLMGAKGAAAATTAVAAGGGGRGEEVELEGHAVMSRECGGGGGAEPGCFGDKATGCMGGSGIEGGGGAACLAVPGVGCWRSCMFGGVGDMLKYQHAVMSHECGNCTCCVGEMDWVYGGACGGGGGLHISWGLGWLCGRWL